MNMQDFKKINDELCAYGQAVILAEVAENSIQQIERMFPHALMTIDSDGDVILTQNPDPFIN
jgi:hypothetical protein